MAVVMAGGCECVYIYIYKPMGREGTAALEREGALHVLYLDQTT